MSKMCFLMGHREADKSIEPLLIRAIRDAICAGVTEFVVGHYGGFDQLASYVLALIKKEHAEIKLTLLLPYYDFNQGIALPVGFDGSLYPNGQERVPKRLGIVRANEYMLSQCDYAIFYARYPGSNTMKLYDKALRAAKHRDLVVVNIGDNSTDVRLI